MSTAFSIRRKLFWSLGSIVVASLLLLSPHSYAAQLTGRVVAVADGDTITVLDSNWQQNKVRLNGIDAPEKSQPFGSRSRQHLRALVHGRDIVVKWNKRDRYGRILGKVLVGSVDVNLEQIRAGLAWHYKRYEREQSREDRETYATAELDARTAKRGLWIDPAPIPPWEFRRAHH